MEQRNGRPAAARAITKALWAVLAMSSMALPLTGQLRTAPFPHGSGSSTSMMVLEKERHPSEVIVQPLLLEGMDAPDIAGTPAHLDDQRLLSHQEKVHHLLLEADPQWPRACCPAITACTIPWVERS